MPDFGNRIAFVKCVLFVVVAGVAVVPVADVVPIGWVVLFGLRVAFVVFADDAALVRFSVPPFVEQIVAPRAGVNRRVRRGRERIVISRRQQTAVFELLKQQPAVAGWIGAE